MNHIAIHNCIMLPHTAKIARGGNFSIRSHTLREIQKGPKGRGKNTKLGEVMKIL